MASKLIETQWGIFSVNFIKFHRLPFGCELRLFDAAGRKKRTDFLVKRKRVSSKTMNRADDSNNVKWLLDTALEVTSTDLMARRLKIELFGPNGKKINGNTLIGKVRQMPPKPTEHDIDRMHEEEHLISEVQSNAQSTIVEAEYLIDDPSTIVCSGYVRALVERYGRESVVTALGR
jgi:hypothetical protein